MKDKLIFALSALGIAAGLAAAVIFGIERKAQPPVFDPASSPYASAIYANGIVESDQPSGENINIYPEVAGLVTRVLVRDGQRVSAGTPLFAIDDSVQRASAAQLHAQAQAALALLQELRAQPRAETLAIAKAQVVQAESSLELARRQYDKRLASFDVDPRSISKDTVDTAHDALAQAQATLEVARRQYELTRAGAWHFDVQNQQQIQESLAQAANSADALLAKYVVRAQTAGVVLAVNAAVGSYVTSQGSYDPYTQGYEQLVVMGGPQEYLAVRCYVDEILVSRIPATEHLQAQMSLRGSATKIALEFVRIQPYVTPKIELSNERLEQVDLRVLPVIFRFPKKDVPVYPGQLVDVYISTK
jgi:HlyD family secretion protein